MSNTPLNSNSFAQYPPLGKDLALAYIDTLRRMPAVVLPSFLVSLYDYDQLFPVEQTQVRHQLEQLKQNPALLNPLFAIKLSSSLTGSHEWVKQPRLSLQKLTAELWSSQQMDKFRTASLAFVQALGRPETRLPTIPRLLLIMIGKDVMPATEYTFFSKLQGFGRKFTAFDGTDTRDAMTEVLRRRAAAMQQEYAHWYIDGDRGDLVQPMQGVVRLHYDMMSPLKQRILSVMRDSISAGSGPEALRESLSLMKPDEHTLTAFQRDVRLRHFAMGVLTEGAGSQIFSTSFVQWAGREVIRRADPQTLLARFTPRQRQSSFNKMVIAGPDAPTDAWGSLIDGDMAAWYLWLELQKLPSPSKTLTVVWAENSKQAVAVGHEFARGTVSDRPCSLRDLLLNAD
jgi:hypothetical protein